MSFIHDLDAIIAKRKTDLPEGSYTTSLFEAGVDRILRKVGEEAGEVIIAGKNKDSQEVLNESADLLYHMLVHLHAQGVDWDQLEALLRERHG